MMLSEHLKTFLWLRFRLRRNQLRKGGIANQVLLILYLIMVGSSAIGLFSETG